MKIFISYWEDGDGLELARKAKLICEKDMSAGFGMMMLWGQIGFSQILSITLKIITQW